MLSGKNVFIFVVVSLVVTAVGYYGALEVPFYLDDRSSITHNANFINANIASLFDVYGMRFVGYFTLWINYIYGADSASGFHIVNIVIHLVNGLLVFALTRKLLELTMPNISKDMMTLMSASAALIFLSHPLNSQAVVYIVQRLASLVTFFYLGAVLFYLKARTSSSRDTRYLYFGLCFLLTCLALFTKQNAVTIPIALFLMELIIFKSVRLRYPLAFVLVCGVIFVAGLAFSTEGSFFHQLDNITRENKDISRLDYLLVQAPIITIYIQKFFLPLGLHLDYGLTLDSFSSFQKIGALVVHVLLLCSALLFRNRAPLLALGIVLFYILHSVESGLIPITDLAFEHRTYLPNFALILCLVAVCGLIIRGEKLQSLQKSFFIVPLGVLVLALTALTHERVAEWKEPKKFYEKELELSPNNVRTMHNFAEYLIREGNLDNDKVKAGLLLDRMYEHSNGKLDGVMVNTHLVYLMGTKNYRKAAKLGESLLLQPLHPVTLSLVKENLGVVFTTLGDYKKAVKYFRTSHSLENLKPSSRIAYAFALFKMRRKAQALTVAESILLVEPDNSKAKELIALIKG